MAHRFLQALAISLALIGSALADVARIGAEDDWFPYTALRNGRIEGMSVDIVRAALSAGGARFELAPYPYSRCMELARNGSLAACFALNSCCLRRCCSVTTSSCGDALARHW
jgi:polar amino acid transport system substrate-binding protein